MRGPDAQGNSAEAGMMEDRGEVEEALLVEETEGSREGAQELSSDDEYEGDPTGKARAPTSDGFTSRTYTVLLRLARMAQSPQGTAGSADGNAGEQAAMASPAKRRKVCVGATKVPA